MIERERIYKLERNLKALQKDTLLKYIDIYKSKYKKEFNMLLF